MSKAPAAHGVSFVALAAISSGNELADYVRKQLLPEAQPPATDDRARRRADAVYVLAEALNREAQLCVFDNFESALDEAGAAEATAFIRELLEATGEHLRLLVTCRRPLGLRAETVYAVQPLVEPKAVDLFYDRSALERSPQRDERIIEICRLVDHLPLAVELAALAVGHGQRPLADVLEGLRITPLDINAAKTLDYPERQQGLIASFRYTFEHLPMAARRLLCAFTVFRGDADRPAVQAIDGTDDWEAGLTALVQWRLLTWTEQNDTYRYSMLATTAAFAGWALQQYGTELGLNAVDLAARHARHYVTVAERFDETSMERWREIDLDWENIKAGANWAVAELEAQEHATVDELFLRLDSLPTDQHVVPLAGQYAYQLYNYIVRRRLPEGRYWLAAGLIAYHRAGHKFEEALLCNELGLWLKFRGAYAEALRWYEQSVVLKEELGDKAGLATSYTNIGSIHYARGAYGEALAWFEKSVVLNEKLGDKVGLAMSYNNIGAVQYARGANDEALMLYEKSVALAEELSEKAWLVATYTNIGEIHRAHGTYAEALTWYEKSVALAEELGDKALAGDDLQQHRGGSPCP